MVNIKRKKKHCFNHTPGLSAMIPKTSIPGICWPAVTGPGATMTLALLYQLQQSQWWSPRDIQIQQFRQAQFLLEHAAATVPFYRDSFRTAGIIPGNTPVREYWPQVPLLKRHTLQQQKDSLLSDRVPASHGKTMTISTSGSTGTPVTVTKTTLMQFLWECLKLREQEWGRLDVGKGLAVIRFLKDRNAAGPPHGLHLNGWGKPFDQLYDTGESWLLSIESPVTAQVDWLCRVNPDYLLTYPTNLMALSRVLEDGKKSLPNLQRVTTISEYLSPDVRKACEEFFQVPIMDTYSTQEMGYIALQCPDHPHYHVQSETVLVEVLDDQDRPCRAGETGRLVVTSLHNFAMPLIRYEIGDYAEVGEPCPCGRGLPILNRISGRVRNMVTLPTGDRHWPRLHSQDYAARTGAPIRQAQLVQHSVEHVEVRLAVSPPLDAQQEEKLSALIQGALGHPFTISFTCVDEIPRSKSGKFEEFISRINT